MTRAVLVALGLAALAGAVPRAQQAALSPDRGVSASPVPALAPTNHPRLSQDAMHLWLAPDSAKAEPSAAALERALTLFEQKSDAQALAALSMPQAQSGTLGTYATYYAASAQLRLGKHVDALRLC